MNDGPYLFHIPKYFKVIHQILAYVPMPDPTDCSLGITLVICEQCSLLGSPAGLSLRGCIASRGRAGQGKHSPGSVLLGYPG
jgi:hypothetical protein